MRTPTPKDLKHANRLRLRDTRLRYVMTVDLNDPESMRQFGELMRSGDSMFQAHPAFGLRDTRDRLVADGFVIVREEGGNAPD